ncbi:MAG: serine/threonine-protein kinase [candidate division WOR-3 bacterium]
MAEERLILENRYEIIEEIARGGFAILYKGRDLRLQNRPVAIKKLRESFIENESALRMFLAEIDLTIKLEHPNIVRIYDTIKINNNYYIVFEFVDGVDLKKLIIKTSDSKTIIPFNLSAYIISEVCEALHYAHNLSDSATGIKLGIVHRDISPQNILLSYNGDVKLTDFGIAKARGLVKGDSSTRVGMVKGKLSYMAPEQAQGKPVDRRSDIYSLGLVMYELMSGKKLFNADTDHQLLQKVARGGIDKKQLETLNAPELLKNVLLKALEVDPSKRFQNAIDMKKEIDKFLISYENCRDELGQFITVILAKKGLEELEPTATAEAISPAESGIKREEPAKGEERTLIDIIKVTAYSARRFALTIGIALIVTVLGLTALDTFKLQMTPIGRGIYNLLFPPIAEINTLPEGATVVLDGKPLKQKTPTTIPKISPGMHTLKLVLSGYDPIEKTISIKGKQVEGGNKIFDAFVVSIDIETQPPGAKVYINGKEYPNVTPIYNFKKEIAQEDIKLRLEHSDFKPIEGTLNLVSGTATKSKDLIVQKEEGQKIRYKISAVFSAECKITVTPPDADVIVNNELYKGNVTLLLPYGNNSLEVRKEGFITHRQNIEVKTGSIQPISISLKKAIVIYAVDKITGEKISTAKVNIAGNTFLCGNQIQIGTGLKNVTIFAPYYISKTITIDPGKESNKIVEMERAKPQLKIKVVYLDTEEPVVEAFIKLYKDGVFQKNLGWTLGTGMLDNPEELEEGDYEIEIKTDVGRSYKQFVSVKWGEENFKKITIPRE